MDDHWSCLSCVWGYVAKQGPHTQSHSVMPCDRSTACSFRSLTSNAHGQMHECVPIRPTGGAHIRLCPGHHFLARDAQTEGQLEGQSAAQTLAHME